MSEHDTLGDAAAGTGPAQGLFRSLMKLLTTVLEVAQTRLELLTTEVQEELRRSVELLIWTFAAIFMTGIGLFMAGFTIIVVFWDGNRVLAAILVSMGFFALAAISLLMLRTRIRNKPPLFEATRTELSKDRAQFSSHS